MSCVGGDPTRRDELRSRLLAYLRRCVAEVTGVEAGDQVSLAARGMDSLRAAELSYRIEEDLELAIDMAALLETAGLEQLAEQLESLLAAAAGEAAAGEPASAAPAAAGQPAEHPLSAGQQALWFLHRLEPASAAYNIAVAMRVLGELDTAALRRAFAVLGRRHAALGSSFHDGPGGPRQRFPAGGEIACSEVDVPAAALDSLLAAAAWQPFDLERGPLARVLVARPRAAPPVLLLVVHHLVCDLWSLSLMAGELAALYRAERGGAPAALPPPPALGYADYVRWQSQLVRGEQGERLWRWWRGELGSRPPATELPADRPRPASPGEHGAARGWRLDAESSDRLRALARREGVTLQVVLASAFQTLLHRYTGQPRLAHGIVAAGRTAAAWSGVVGYFANPLVLCGDLAGEPCGRELLRRTSGRMIGALRHQDLPFPLLVERLHPARAAGEAPLFRAMFVFQGAALPDAPALSALALNQPGARLALGDLELESVALAGRPAQFDLTATLAEWDQGLAATFGYRTALFDGATIERWLGHYRSLLQGLAADPDRAAAELPLLAAAERHALLAEWNWPDLRFDRRRPLHRLFEEQADLRPLATALVCGEERLTYAELDAAANRLAHLLRGQGVGPEVAVALLLERSIAQVVAILAVLKAGGLYVPLEPDTAGERLAFALADSGARVLVTEQRLEERLAAPAAPEAMPRPAVVRLDADAAAIARQPSTRPATPRGGGGAEHAAYLIYTSGSTGRPKGVVVRHGEVTRLLAAASPWFDFGPGDVWTLFHSHAFDFSVWEIWGALAHGGSLVVVPFWTSRSPRALLELLRERRVTVLNQTPSAFRQLAHAEAELAAPPPLALRWVIFGGEALDPALLQGWIERRGDERPRLVNMYGITETTVHVTVRRMRAGDPAGCSLIGRPLPDLQAYLLDGRLLRVPIGVAGEICVGGDGLARGYLGRPDLTAERFVPDPWSGRAGARLYRSGDLARHRADGELEYLGRIDQQVKIRGFRIELVEIEAALAAHHDVRAAVVLARERAAGDRHLVAYLVPRRRASGGGRLPTAAELRAFLGDKLPAYALPSSFVTLPELPLTVNGKVDRAALPSPAHERSEDAAAAGAGAASTAVEEMLCGIWAEVLGLRSVGVGENFFELGGDSVLSLQVASRARVAGLSLTPRQLFQHQTIAELAASLDAAPPDEAPPAAGAVDAPAAGPRPVPLTPIQRRFFERGLPDPHHWNQSVWLQARSELSPAALAGACGWLIRRHDALRLRFAPRPGSAEWQQHLAPPGNDAACGLLDLGALPEAARQAAFRGAAARLEASLDLAHGPLLRVLLVRGLRPAADGLLLVAHHLAVDAVSWPILVADLETAYRQLRRREPVRLAAASTPFAVWAERLAAIAAGEDARLAAGFWLGQLSGAAPSPSRLAGGGSAAGRERDAALRVVRCSEPATAALARLQRTHALQPQELLLTALLRALAPRLAERRLLVDLEGHGREELAGTDLSRTVGWFTSIYPVLLDLGGASGPDAELAAVREQLRRVPRRGFGYGLARHGGGDPVLAAELAGLPAAGVLFNYLGRLEEMVPAGSLFAHAELAPGPQRSPRGTRSHHLQIDAAIRAGGLELAIAFDGLSWGSGEIGELGDRLRREVELLAAHCQEQPEQPEQPPEQARQVPRPPPQATPRQQERRATPADFPLARISQADLDRLLADAGGVEDVYPLSPMQEGILFHALEAGSGGEYFEQLICRLRGAVDAAVLRAAWAEVVDRQPALRTAFPWWSGDGPLQVVRERVEMPWRELDWQAAPPAERQTRLEALLAAERERGFDLAAAPLLRLTLVWLAPDEARLIFSHHHLLLDGWCLPLLLGDVLAAYRALRRGEPLRRRRERPFRDYIAWLSRQDGTAAEGFWRAELAGLSAPATLAGSRAAATGPPEPAADAAAGGHARAEGGCGPLLTGRLQQLARRWRVTLSTLFQGAWGLLLSRYSGEPEVVFGTAVSGRPAELEGVERMVGLFINTLPVRVRAAEDRPLQQWLPELQERQAARLQHQHLPLARIQGLSGLAAGQPLFDTLLVFENYPLRAVAALGDGFELDAVELRERTNLPLTVGVLPLASDLSLAAGYQTSRFDAVDVKRLLGHLRQLLAGFAAASPETCPGDLSLLTESERQQLREWNDSAMALPAAESVATLIAGHALERPDACAVIAEDGHLTYAELDRRTSSLARQLRRRGVRAEDRVGVAMERSLASLIAALGVWKAGACYLPLDPEYPPQRLALMVADAGAALVLTTEALQPRLPAELGAEVLRPDGGEHGEPDPAAEVPGSCPPRPPGDGACYLIYTSGSTGRPKGVINTHRALLNHVLWRIAATGFSRADRNLHRTELSFDVSMTEIATPLTAGGAVVIAPPGAQRLPASLAEIVTRQRVTMMHCVPSLLVALLDEPAFGVAAGAGGSMRLVSCGGEELRRETVDRFRMALTAELYNLYGPTESAVDVTWWPCGRTGGRQLVPIGRPCSNNRALVLDAAWQPAPAGVAGELCVAGANLARGYFGRPELTAERFIPDPSGAAPGARLYRTGDLARWLADGTLQFLGRRDHQVKVRGYRVEPDEIASVLAEHEAVRQVAVVARSEAGGERLAAYVVGRGEAVPEAAELRAWLARRLPAYMVPAWFVMLPSLPLTVNGKLDRAALPPPGELPRPERPHAEPVGDTERLLAAIWSEVLGLPRIDRDDHFLELGGDSILSLRVAAQAHRAGLPLTPGQVLRHPTVAELAACLAAGGGADAAASPAGVGGAAFAATDASDAAADADELPLTPIQRRFFAQRLPNPHHWNQALLLEPERRLEPRLLAAALAQLPRRHDALRLRFAETAGGWRQTGAPAFPATADRRRPLCTIDLSAAPAERDAVMRAAAAAAQASLDLVHGPLWQAVLCDCGAAAPARLLIVVHHLAVDAVSWGILLEDLDLAYRQLAAAQPLALPAPSASFATWTRRLQALACSGELALEEHYWQAALADPPGRLPLDFPAGEGVAANTRGNAGSVLVRLSDADTSALLREVPAARGSEIGDALLAALARAFAPWTGGTRLLLDLESHGRAEAPPGVDLSRTIGWFTAIFPQVLDLGGSRDSRGDLEAVKQQLRRVPRRGLGYGLLRYAAAGGDGGDGGDADGVGAGGSDGRAEPSGLAASGAEVLFNYLGQIDRMAAGSTLRPTGEPCGPYVDPGAPRPYLIEINCWVSGGCLTAEWTYSPVHHRRATVEGLAERHLAHLRTLIAECRGGAAADLGPSPADFPEMDFGQQELDELLAELGQLQETS